MTPKEWRERVFQTYRKGALPVDSKVRVARTLVYPRFVISGATHLPPEFNRGCHALYLDVLDKDGKQIPGATITWGWEGMRADQTPFPLMLDKPAEEFGGNIPLYAGMRVYAEVLGWKSDEVSSVHTGWPDEGSGNTWGHHSFYVQWVREEGTTPPPPPDEEEPGGCVEELTAAKGEIERLKAVLQRIKGMLEAEV